MSPYFPPLPPDGRIYWCPKCRARYRVVSNLSCLVLHSPGDCCHMGEERVTEPREPLTNAEVEP